MKRKSVFILKGNIVYSKNQKEFSICENGYVVCKDGIVEGVYKTLPFKFGGNPIRDYKDALIIPGFTDLHVHAPQYSYRGLGCASVFVPRSGNGYGIVRMARNEYVSGGIEVL